jgi:hypothetical protein
MSSKEARVRDQIRTLSGSERKVFDAVPIDAAWSIVQIIERIAVRGVRPEHRTVKGSLQSLEERGLIVEYGRDHYRRVTFKPKETNPTEVPSMPDMNSRPAVTPVARLVTPPAKPGDPVSMLTQIAVELRATASAIDGCLLAIMERQETTESGLGKLRQLQALLVDLTPAK